MKKSLFFSIILMIFSQTIKAQTSVIKTADFTQEELAKIQAILKGTDPSMYNLTIEQGGKVTRLGSAAIRSLTTVSAYHQKGGEANAVPSKIITKIGGIISYILTNGFVSQYPDKVKQINAILEAGAKRAAM